MRKRAVVSEIGYVKIEKGSVPFLPPLFNPLFKNTVIRLHSSKQEVGEHDFAKEIGYAYLFAKIDSAVKLQMILSCDSRS